MNPLHRSSQILSKVESKGFLEGIFALDTDWDAALNARDSGTFDEAWSASDAQVLSAHDSTESSVVLSLRETVFKRVLSLTGSSEVAGYASDDFGLIAKAAEAGLNIPFVDGLWNSYRDGFFPGG